MSSLSAKLNKTNGVVQELNAAAGNAGLSIGVMQNGEIVYTTHYGLRKFGANTPPKDDTVYHLGSLTKLFICAGLAILVDEGKLTWDSKLLDVIPSFHQRSKEVEENATIIDLLAHRMGLSMRMNYWAQMEQELLLPSEETVNVLGDLSKLADFRTTIKYNNWTYGIAGQLIERLSGLSLENFMQENIFQPLGLLRTTFATPSSDNYSSCHITLSDGTPYEIFRPVISNGTLMAGAAGLKSTLSDLLKAYDALLAAYEDQQRTNLTSTAGNPFRQTKMIFTPHNKKGSTEYGLGLFLTELPADIGWIGINDGRVVKNPIIAKGITPTRIAYHNGSMPGVLTSVHLIPELQISIVILGNTLSFADLPDFIGGLFLEIILDSEEKTDFLPLVEEAKAASINGPLKTAKKLADEKKEGTSHRPLEQYSGHYVNSKGNFVLDVKVSGSGLRMHLQGLPKTYYDLEHYHDDIFAWSCERDAEAKRGMFPQLSDAFRKVTFQSDARGDIKQIWWAYARDEPAGETFVKKEGAESVANI